MSGRLSRAPVIEGSLTAVLDDDSSDDESDSGQPPTREHHGEDCEDDQQEELEVFTVPKVKLSSNRNESKKTDSKSETSLASALAASIQMVERSGLADAEAARKSKSIGNTSLLSKASPALKTETTEGDIFGIVYKPFIKKREEYSMPKRSAFEDEASFEGELQFPVQKTKTSLDDEFDFEESASPKAPIQKLIPAHKAVDIAEKSKNEAEEDARFIAALKIENNILLEKQGINTSSNTPDSSSSQNTKSSISVSARQSLDEIVNIYSSGLGDQEVRLLDMKSCDDSARVQLPYHQHNKGVSTIEEGDEDEAEKEEQEEEQREIIALDTAQILRINQEAEWDSVVASNAYSTSAHTPDSDFSEISYAEALTYLSAQNMSEHEKMIFVRNEASSTWSLLNRPTALKFSGSEEKLKFPFLLAQVDYDPSTPLLLDTLRTIFKALIPLSCTKDVTTNSSDSIQCPRVGPHWERIGFQGLDPRTDINRSMKMLAILQTLQLIETAPSLVAPSFAISNLLPSPSTGGHDLSWPFMCVSIMFTKEAVQAVRSGELNRECNQQMDVLNVMHEFHHACFFDFVRRVIEEPLTHHAMHLAKVRESCSKSPMDILKNGRAAASKNYSALSLVVLFDRIKNIKKKVPKEDAKSVPKDKFAAGAQEIDTEIGDLNFDDLETIEKVIEAETAGTKEEKKTFSKSVWLNLTGGSKAAKFKV